jgi:hypothetical protein
MADDADLLAAIKERIRGTRVNYIKSALFRVIHVDGAYGGVTPRGYIHASIYNERRPIPRVTKLEIDDATDRVTEANVRSKSGLAREVEADLIFDDRAAEEFATWLMTKVNEVRSLRAKAESGQQNAEPE